MCKHCEHVWKDVHLYRCVSCDRAKAESRNRDRSPNVTRNTHLVFIRDLWSFRVREHRALLAQQAPPDPRDGKRRRRSARPRMPPPNAGSARRFVRACHACRRRRPMSGLPRCTIRRHDRSRRTKSSTARTCRPHPRAGCRQSCASLQSRWARMQARGSTAPWSPAPTGVRTGLAAWAPHWAPGPPEATG